MPLGAACYPDVDFCVPTESCGSSYICCFTSHCVTAFEGLKFDVKLIASA